MKIGFITDTNILKKNDEGLNKEERFLDNIDFFVEYIESLEKTSSNKELIYFMPTIIIEELYHQKLSTFNTRYKVLKERYDDIKYGLNGEFPKCVIEKVLLEEKEKYINNDKIVMLDLPYNESIFKELIVDALRKNPPFDKSMEKGKADAGFKDALIWKSIIHNKVIDDCEKMYFFSGDKIFSENEESLINEFKEHHGDTELKIMYYEPNGKQRQSCLKTVIQDNNLIETEIIKLYDLDLILNHIKDIKYNYMEEVYYNRQEQSNKLTDVLFNKFSTNDFNIENVTEEDGKYQVLIQYRTEKYNISNEIAIDNVSRKILKGELKLFFKKNKKSFELESYEIIYSKFAIGIEEAIYSLSKAMKESLLNSDIEKYTVNLTKSLSPISESIASLKSKLIDSERINSIINTSPLWMEEIKRMSNDLLYYKSLTDGLEKNSQETEEDKKKTREQNQNNKRRKNKENDSKNK